MFEIVFVTDFIHYKTVFSLTFISIRTSDGGALCVFHLPGRHKTPSRRVRRHNRVRKESVWPWDTSSMWTCVIKTSTSDESHI